MSMDWDDQAVPGYVEEVEVVGSPYTMVQPEDEQDTLNFSLHMKGDRAQPTSDSVPLWNRLSDSTKKDIQTKLNMMKAEKQNGCEADMKDLKSFIPEINEAVRIDLQKLPVKKLRKLIPIMRVLVYMKEDQYEGKKKLKHLWDDRPADWPMSVPFIDPNNGVKKDQSAKVAKPGKGELLKMFTFLKDKYKRWGSPGKYQPVQEEKAAFGPGHVKKHHPEHEYTPPSISRATLEKSLSLSEQERMVPVQMLGIGMDPAKSMMVRLQPLFDHIRGLGGDHPGLHSLHRLEKLLESFYEHDKRKYIQLGHDVERLFDELFMMDAKQEDWSKFGADCKDLLQRWVSALTLDVRQTPPQEMLVYQVGEETAPEAPVQNRLLSHTGPYIPDILQKSMDSVQITTAKTKISTEEEPEEDYSETSLQTLGIDFRQPLEVSEIGNVAKQKCDVQQKGQDRMCDDQNFKDSQNEKYAEDPMWCSNLVEEQLKSKAMDEVLALEESLGSPKAVYESQQLALPQPSLTHTEIATSPGTGATYAVLEPLSPMNTSTAPFVPPSTPFVVENNFPVGSNVTLVDDNTIQVVESGHITASVSSVDGTSSYLCMLESPETTASVSNTDDTVSQPPTTMDTAILHNLLQSQQISEISGETLQMLLRTVTKAQVMETSQPVEQKGATQPVVAKQEAKPFLCNLLPTVVEEMELE